MRIRRLTCAAALAFVFVVGNAGCNAPRPVDPVVVSVDDLKGARIEVPLNSTLVILTGWSDVDGYTAAIADPAIADFVRGAKTGEAAFSPRLTPRQVGDTEVTLSNEAGNIRTVQFTLEVTPAQDR